MTLYVSDLDGTLLQPDARLSDKTLKMLNRSIADGKLFTIATARTPATVAGIISGVEMNLPAIVMTGAAMWNPAANRYFRTERMTAEAAIALADVYRESGFPIFHFTLEDDMINIYHIGGSLNELECQFVEERIDSPYKRFHLRADGKEILPPDPSKTILFYGMQPTALAEAAFARARRVEGARSQFYHDIYGPEIGILEAFAPQATKANAVEYMKKITGADRVVAFGDNINDIPMLEKADVAVAVDNALDEVKRVADIIIGPNTSDSVAEFILNDR